MTQAKENSGKAKLSAEFTTRLDRLDPKEKVRAIVLLVIENGGKTSQGRASRAKRRELIERTGKSAEPALREIDGILERYDGKRLTPSPDALGSIPIESTPAGINALAASRHVKTILEDQPISLLSSSPIAPR